MKIISKFNFQFELQFQFFIQKFNLEIFNLNLLIQEIFK